MININFTNKLKESGEVFCFFVDKTKKFSENAMHLDGALNNAISLAMKASDSFDGEFGKTVSVSAIKSGEKLVKVIIFGVGKKSELTEAKIESLGGMISSALLSIRCKSASIESFAGEKISLDQVAAHLAFGSVLRSYSFGKYHTMKKPDELPILEKIEFVAESAGKAEKYFEPLKSVAEAIYVARDVISEPGNVLYPQSYADIIREKLEALDVEVEILGEREMQNMGMNALLGVGQGSQKESKLVVMKYTGTDEKDKPVAFVGKGVTFDTGGISIKPSANMGDMKYDMAGSAAVFGTIMALAKRKARVNAIGVVGLVENMPGGNAQRPGDVVKSLSGKTIEILDTDAEGRLVLADALWYTQEKFKPKFMVDLATLTGAITIALGNVYGGLFCNDERLAENLSAAGKLSGEELWRMPLHSEYDKMIKSDIADVANLGAPRGHASSNTAAQFLQHFVNKTPWAHLDIAGVANASKPSHTHPKGAVGYGIRLLNRLVKENYEQ